MVEAFSTTRPAIEAAGARVIVPTTIQRQNRDFEPALRAQMGADIKFASIAKDTFADDSPWLKIAETQGMRVGLIPTTMCGAISEPALMETTMIGNTIFHEDPTVQKIVAISNAENRGDKKTIDANGNHIDQLEHRFAMFMAEMLRGPGHIDSIVALDPHSAAFSEAFGVSDFIAISPLPEIAAYMQERGLLRPEMGLVAPDAGGLGRTLLLAQITGLPIVAFIEKERKNGKVGIKAIHGDINEIQGRELVCPDDIIATASTAAKDSRALKEMGALGVHFIATHIAKVPGNREAVGNLLQEGALLSVTTTNSSAYQDSLEGIDGVHFVDALSIVAKAGHALLVPSRPDLQEYLNAHRYPLRTADENIQLLRDINPRLLRDLPAPTNAYPGHSFDLRTLSLPQNPA